MNISQKDRAILRDLAKYHAELAASERNRRLYQDWMTYGSSKGPTRPMIRIEINTFEHQILPAMMKCEGDEARAIERNLLRPIANFTLFEDDTLIPQQYNVRQKLSIVPFGLPVRREETGSLGHHFIPYLHDLEEDEHLLGPSRFHYDYEGTKHAEDTANEIFGDILPAKIANECAYSCITQDIVHIMNMDDMYIAMMDEEERFHKMMRQLTDDYLAMFTMMAEGGHYTSCARDQHLNQGSYCFTDELPDGKPNAALKDMWIFMDSQETAGISPAMYKELVWPYYKELMSCFGLSSYGCCEASHPIWDNCLSELENLRKVSISPWCDEEFMGERLRGTGITFLRKPPATILGMDIPVLDEEATLNCFRKTAQAARGCKLEIAQRDVYMVGNSPEKVRRFVELARKGLEA